MSTDRTGTGVDTTRLAHLRVPKADELPVIEPDAERLQAQRIVGFASRDIRTRAFNLLRSQIVKELAAVGQNVLGVTSAAPAAGKSFLSLNLAAALSQMGERPIYLFDFDLRRGSIGRALGIEDGPGLGAYLSGEVADLSGIGRRIRADGFCVFPAFADPDTGADLFAGPRFAALIEAMRRLPREAIILCDLPPAFASDDAALITQRLDSYLLVVEQGVTTEKQVLSAIDLLRPALCLGTVFNRYDGGWSDPYGYGYGDKYAGYYG